MRRTLSGLPLVLGLALGAACKTGDAAFPESGTLTLQVIDATLAGQTAEEPANQFVLWTLSEAAADVAGVGTVNFLGQSPCQVGQRILALGNTCRITGLVLEPGSTGTATVRVGITTMEVIRAERPELTASGDLDDDGVLDLADNCPYVENADQLDGNDDDVGDACSISDDVRDTDGDTVADFTDNCVYVPNLDQVNASRGDGFADGVGDACEQRVLVTLPAGGLVIERANQPFAITSGRVTVFQLDFRSKDSLACDAAFTSCTIPDPDAVILTAL